MTAAHSSASNLAHAIDAGGQPFELAIVVDTSRTMALWDGTAEAVCDFVKDLRVLTGVRTFRLDSDRDSVELFDEQRVMCEIRDLHDTKDRRLIIVLTDAVGPLWRTAAAREMLAYWTAHARVAIVQVLPASMWHRTALPPVSVELTCGSGAVAYDSAGPWLPVVALSSDPSGAFVRLVAGEQFESTPSHAVPVGRLPAPALHDSAVPAPARDRVARFQATASATAFALASDLAAAPLTMPLMQAMRAARYPMSHTCHLAEVLLSGLLVEVPAPQLAPTPEHAQYDFLPNVRVELLRSRSRRDVYSVLEALREIAGYTPHPFGQLDVWALSFEPSRNLALTPECRPVAEVAITVLSGLGGQFVKRADGIQTALVAHDTSVGLRTSTAAVQRIPFAADNPSIVDSPGVADKGGRDETSLPIAALKILVAGGFGSGKTTMVGAVSEISPLRTEEVLTTAGTDTDDTTGVATKTTTTVAMDFGRITIDPSLVLYLFGTPGQNRFWFLWDELATGALGAVVIADTRRLADSFAAIDYFEQRGTPFVVAVNCFDSEHVYTGQQVREALDIEDHVPVLLCDARDRISVRQVLVKLVEHVRHVEHIEPVRTI